MKKFAVLLLLVLPLLAFSQIEAGKMNAGVAGSITVKPAWSAYIGGHFGKMFTDAVEFGLSGNFSMASGGDPSFGTGLYVAYHMPLAEGIFGLASLGVDLPIKPSFTHTEMVDLGVDYFVGDQVAIRLCNRVSIPEFDFGNLSDIIIIGTVAFF